MKEGIVSPLCTDTLAVPGAQWLGALASLSTKDPLAIRAGLKADATDHVPLAQVKQALRAYAQGGHEVYVVLEQALSRYHELHPGDIRLLPNAQLGLQGNPLLNDWINRLSLNACSIMRQFAAEGLLPKGVFILNETNLMAETLTMGKVPPVQKGAALCPEVFGAALWTTASRLRATVPELTLWPASMSQLVWFFKGPDANKPWFQDYWEKAIAYLTKCGKAAPWPWEGLCVNLEGPIGHPLPGGKTYCEYVAFTLSQMKTLLGITGPSIVGEWGEEAGSVNIGEMAAAHKALATSPFDHGFFFQAMSMAPGSYGIYNTKEEGGQLIPDTSTCLLPIVQGEW